MSVVLAPGWALPCRGGRCLCGARRRSQFEGVLRIRCSWVVGGLGEVGVGGVILRYGPGESC